MEENNLSENDENDKIYALLVKLYLQNESFWKNFCCCKNVAHILCMASKLLESDKLHLLLLSEDTWLDNNEHLESLKTLQNQLSAQRNRCKNYWSILT